MKIRIALLGPQTGEEQQVVCRRAKSGEQRQFSRGNNEGRRRLDKQEHRQTDSRTDRETDGQTDRQNE